MRITVLFLVYYSILSVSGGGSRWIQVDALRQVRSIGTDPPRGRASAHSQQRCHIQNKPIERFRWRSSYDHSLLAAAVLDRSSHFVDNLSEDDVQALGESFYQRLIELATFRDQHGHTVVPRRYEDNPSLGNWVNKVRQHYKKHQEGKKSPLTQGRIDVLNEMGFVWDARAARNERRLQADGVGLTARLTKRGENRWNARFQELREYAAEHGTCDVPSAKEVDGKPNKFLKLAYWTQTQRNQYRKLTSGEGTSLSQSRVDALNSIGFPWKPRWERLWDERYRHMMEFRKKNGHCKVPISYEDKTLAQWCHQQRKAYKLLQEGRKTPLTQERVDRLNRIGFVWRVGWDIGRGQKWT